MKKLQDIINAISEGKANLELISETVNSQEVEKPIYSDYNVVHTYETSEDDTVVRKIIEKNGNYLYIESDFCADIETTGNCTLEYDKVFKVL
ncbi:hypothetical protein SH2C18_26100 [Clostridium sediminicola]|uniref:hypothetical protein n=1 Tax=Clostridium sediminicola TaxID=3114879 RepID=UPI0031F1DCF3